MPPRLLLPVAAACIGSAPRVSFVLPLSARALHGLARPTAAAPRTLSLTRHLASHTDDPKYQPGAGSRGKPAESTSELLERLEAEARRRATAADAQRDHAGPFPLGVGASGRRKPWKAWSDLGVRGKSECAGTGEDNADDDSRTRVQAERKPGHHPRRRRPVCHPDYRAHYRAVRQELAQRALLAVH